LRGVVLELFRRAEERPLQVGGREVDAAPVGVGIVVVQSIRAGADDAAVEDELFEVEGRLCIVRAVKIPTKNRRFEQFGFTEFSTC